MVLRCYTNWMRNFGNQDIFQKRFSILNFSNQNWMVNSKFHFLSEDKSFTAHVNLHLKQVEGQSLSFKTGKWL